jgi:hypothetical protein
MTNYDNTDKTTVEDRKVTSDEKNGNIHIFI